MSQLAKTYQLSRIPLYVQVATALRRRIEEGQWAPGDKISTLEELQAEFEVARVTVRQAVDLLQKEGLVRRQQGKGTFVAAGLRDRRWLKLETTWSALINTIKDNVPKFIPAKNAPPEPRLAPEDGRPAAEYVFLRSVQSATTSPTASPMCIWRARSMSGPPTSSAARPPSRCWPSSRGCMWRRHTRPS